MKIIKLPGLIDPHVHLRDPGSLQKEDFTTGTSAAIAGGFTTVIDMPNNQVLIDSKILLDEKIAIAKEKIVGNIGFYFGSLGDNLEEFPKVVEKVKGLKLFLDKTTGGFTIDKSKVKSIFEAWPKDKVILLHAENDSLDFVAQLAKETKNKIHICHVATKADLEKVIQAKKEGMNITCGVTPHHLFLTKEDVARLGSLAMVKPPIDNKADQEFLWQHLQDIDVIESDHAPHTMEEKESETPPSGVPNLETTLPLLLTAVSKNKLSIEEMKRLCFENPSQIFEIATNDKTYVEVDADAEYVITDENLFTKCKWSPYTGRKMKGKVIKTVIDGTTVFENGKILVEPGFGKVI